MNMFRTPSAGLQRRTAVANDTDGHMARVDAYAVTGYGPAYLLIISPARHHLPAVNPEADQQTEPSKPMQ